MYEVWYRKHDGYEDTDMKFIGGIKTYAEAARLVCALEESFGVSARIEMV